MMYLWRAESIVSGCLVIMEVVDYDCRYPTSKLVYGGI
jgi:hypothetical protein